MFNLVIKDIIVQKKSIAFAVFYIGFFIFALQSIGEMTFTFAITAFSYILVMGGFAYDDKNKADIMLNSLPLKRRNIVLAKYISLYVFMTFGSLIYFVFELLLRSTGFSFIKTYPVTIESFTGAVFAVSIMHSFCLPILFKFGYTKAKVINFVMFFAFFFGVSQLINYIYAKKNVGFAGTVFAFFENRPDYLIALAVIAAAALLMLISYMISLRVYKKREF